MHGRAPDVTIVGSGIAGGALATVLARSGIDVLVLERQTIYRDHIRGETLFPWGVAEMRRLGLEPTLLDAGGGYATELFPYDELLRPGDDTLVVPLDTSVPDAPGQMNVGHPEACQALTDAAAEAGARVEHGVTHVEVTPGDEPMVSFGRNGETEEVRPKLVVGADGRTSTVRRAAGLELESTQPRVMLAGFLVSDVRGWPETSNAMTIEGDYFTLVFPRPRGIARVYMAYAVENKDRFVGPTKVDDFRRALGEITTVPQIAAIADATPAGPLGSYPMNDSWLTAPLAPGVLLIGDAAGWSDPTIGQGLSVAMRDARIVSDILCSGDHWDFRPYADERAERMRQLRIALEISVATRCDFTDRGRARRAEFNRRMLEQPELVLVSMTPVTGPSPENAAVYTDELLERVRAYGA